MTKRIVLFLWLSIILFMSGLDAQAGFFTPVDSKDLPRAVDVVKNINEMSVLRLNEVALREYLRNAPVEFQNSGNTLSLDIPLPDGRIETFGLVESSILSPEVAARHPEIKSYTGNGLNFKTAVIRVTLTSAGFHAVVLDLNGEEVYFEHYSDNDKDVYFNYFAKDAVSPPDYLRPRCEIDDEIHERSHETGPLRNNSGGTLRTFRLAIAGNAEFTAQNGGTQASGFAKIVNYVATMNLVYRRELSIHFTLVSGTNVVYTNAATDPYTNDLGDDIDANQTNLDAVIGNANYDIGHVMGYSGPNSGGGLAAFQSVCDNATKAQGGSNEGGGPYAQVFFDQLVLHETGHQFGMSHSYNSVIPVCTTRNPGTSVEPGAGATIMSYGFTCGTDDYFTSTTSGPFLNYHTASYEQADTYIGTISCQTTTATGNMPPVVTVPSDVTIPRSTPFSLTGSANAPESGDAYTYSWEGVDIGAIEPTAGTLDDTTQPPFFRSYAPSASGATRTFPILSAILDGTNQAKGDKLPSITIATNLRLTVRDNNTAGGGLSYQGMIVNIDGSIGPFLETTNLAASYPAGSTQTITWSVNGTNVATPTVNILLSTDGGLTFPYTLATATGNDGTELVTFPNIQTSTARIKVEAVGNIFFDISNFNFSIEIPGCTAVNSNICPTDAMTFNQGDAGLNLGLSNTFGSVLTQTTVTTTNASPSGELANATTPGGTSCQTDWGVERYTTFDFSVSTAGSYTFTKNDQFFAFSIFEAAGYNPAIPCSGTFLGSNASGAISAGGSATVTLNACTTYKLVAWEVNGDNVSSPITFSGPGDVYGTATAPANAGYTYVAVNTVNNQIVAQSATSDFTALAGGTYKVYGASYKNGGAAPPADANPAGWIGQTLAAVQSSECVVFSSNCKSLTVVPSNNCNITATLAKTDETMVGANDGTITVTANCSGTCGTLQYALNGGTPQASNVFTGLAPGSYTVEISNVGTATCTDMETITINAAVPPTCNITATLAKMDESVAGANDGTITVTANCSGTCGTLQYSLNGGTPQASNVFMGLAPGDYMIEISNVGTATCTDIESITINAGPAPSCNITATLAKTDETAMGANDGTITVTANCTGTCGTLQYSLNGGTPQASNVFTGLAPGTYSIEISNVGAATCSDTETITINAFMPVAACNITATLAKTDETVLGANDGTITVTASCSGDCGTLQYALNGGTPQASNVFTGLAPGPYSIEISNVGTATCSDTETITINAGPAPSCNITATLDKTDETVTGANDGTITVNALCSGTCGTLQYALNGGTPQASNVFTGLAPGDYMIEISNVGTATCTDIESITINAGPAPNCNITATLDKTDETVTGANDGTITVNASCTGTCGTLQYALNGGTPQASNVFMGLAPGDYMIEISNVGTATCTDIESITINAAPATCSITSSLAKTDETVLGASDGTITVTASCAGTCGTLQYALNGGTPQASNVFMGLAPGTYTVVTSNVGDATCSDTQTITINAGPANCNITSSLAKTDETVLGANDGTITVTASCAGICGTLQYSLDGGTPQASNVFTGLAPGTYTVVTSNVGAATCSDTQMITILAGPVVTPATEATVTTNCDNLTSTINATLSAGEVQWYEFVYDGMAFNLAINTEGSAFDTELGIYDAAGNLIATNDDGGTGTLSLLTLDGLAAGTYYVVVGGFNTAFGAMNFNVTAGTANGAYVLNFVANCGAIPATEATVAINCPDNLTSATNATLASGEVQWYEFVYDGTTSTLEINTEGSAFDTELVPSALN